LEKLVQSGQVELVSSFRIEAIGRTADGRAELVAGEERVLADTVVNSTGFRPDNDMVAELRHDLDPILGSTRALAPLIDPSQHSCCTVPRTASTSSPTPNPATTPAGRSPTAGHPRSNWSVTPTLRHAGPQPVRTRGQNPERLPMIVGVGAYRATHDRENPDHREHDQGQDRKRWVDSGGISRRGNPPGRTTAGLRAGDPPRPGRHASAGRTAHSWLSAGLDREGIRRDRCPLHRAPRPGGDMLHRMTERPARGRRKGWTGCPNATTPHSRPGLVLATPA
jgi:hypothetical protein